MKDEEMEPCYDRLTGALKVLKILILLNTAILFILIGVIIAGLRISYNETYKDVYHTSFVNQDIIKQLYGVDIHYNKSIRKIEVIPSNPEKALINEIIKRK